MFLFCIIGSFLGQSIYAQCDPGESYNTYCYGKGEVNVVAFEVCPAPDATVRSEIIGGSYNTNFPPNIEGLSVYEGTTGSGTSGTLVFGPADGNLTGNVITASAPGLCLIFISNSNTFQTTCSDGFESALEVCSEFLGGGTLFFTAPNDLCIYDGVQSGLSGGSPTGGVYSGPGVTDDGNGMTYSFDPAEAGVGLHTLMYTESGNSVTDDVEVFGNGVNNCAIPDDRVGVGTENDIDESAILEVRSTVKGFLPARMTTAQRNLIPNPAKGLIIYNLTLNCLQVNDGTPVAPTWTCISGI
ncbi:MAG: hypothetical protein HKN68_19745 [Saprospiraceae bacterium]|nr:hypothetical protein [Saprospiraceae bacterium]